MHTFYQLPYEPVAMDESVKWSGVMATFCALTAAVVGITVVDFFLGNPVGSFDLLFVPPAVVASAALGGGLWWLLVERPGEPTTERALLVGFLVGLFAHPLMWVLYLLGGSLFLPAEPLDPSFVAEYALTMSALSVLFSGGLTVLGGLLCGRIVVAARRRLYG